MFKGKLKHIFTAVICAALCMCLSQGGDAAMKKEVISSTKTLPGSGEFNVIAEPFDWGKDVTRLMINPGRTVSASEINAQDFQVSATHYSEQAWTNDSQGPRKVMDAYPVTEDGTKADEADYIIVELEYGAGVQSAHTGSYNYANYYTPLKLTYEVKWSGADSLKQHEVVNLICDEFVLERHKDTSVSNQNNNFVDYAFYKPINDGAKHPLIIFFHGMGEGGARDLKNQGVQMYAYPECNFAGEEIQSIMGGSAYVLLPQSPDRWPTAGFTEESGYLEIVNSLIDSIIENNPDIDTNRIYVGGLSMGGYMASRVILNRPEKYAAAFLCSQAYAITASDAEKLVDLPIWISASEADGTCSMDPYTYASYQKLIAAGGKEKKCAVMEDNSRDPKSRFRFYDGDENAVLYEAEQEHENKVTGQFVWDNVSYSGHNGGWVPVFANGQYYMDENDNKVTIMEWVANQSLASDITLDTTAVKKSFKAGEAFDSNGLLVKALMRDGSMQDITGYSVTAPDMSTPGIKEVYVSYAGMIMSYQIEVAAGSSNNPVINNPVISNPSPSPSPAPQKKVFKVTSKKKIVIKKGKKSKIKVKVSPKTKVKYKSSKKKIASVTRKGVIKGLRKGKAKITVSAFGKKIVVRVTVK